MQVFWVFFQGIFNWLNTETHKRLKYERSLFGGTTKTVCKCSACIAFYKATNGQVDKYNKKTVNMCETDYKAWLLTTARLEESWWPNVAITSHVSVSKDQLSIFKYTTTYKPRKTRNVAPWNVLYYIYIYIYKFTNFHGFLVIYYLSVCLSLLLKANYAEYLHAVLSCPKIKSVHIWTSCVFWFVFVERWQSSLFFGWLYIVYIPIVSVSRRGSWCETRI